MTNESEVPESGRAEREAVVVVNRHPVKTVLDWLRSGYPEGIPEKDHFAMLVVLRRRLSEDELEAVVALSIEHAHETPRRRIDYGHVRAVVADVLREEPSEDDVARVSARLSAGGWPVEHDDSPVPEDRRLADGTGHAASVEQRDEQGTPEKAAPPTDASGREGST